MFNIHIQGNKAKRNIYKFDFRILRKFHKQAITKNNIRLVSLENQNAINKWLQTVDDQSAQVGDSPNQLGFKYDVHKYNTTLLA